MRTGAALLERINRSWPSQATVCRHHPPAVLQGKRPTVVDDSGSLSITVWACTDCGELIEEVRILRRTAELSGGPSGMRAAAAIVDVPEFPGASTRHRFKGH